MLMITGWLLDDYWMFMDVYGRYIQLVTMVYNTERSCRRFILLTWMKGTTPCSKSLNLFVKAQFLQDFPKNQRSEMSVLLQTWKKIRGPTLQIQSTSECLFLLSCLIATIWGLIWRSPRSPVRWSNRETSRANHQTPSEKQQPWRSNIYRTF